MLQSIHLDGFRNYASLDAEFSPRVNVVEGRNAQGKTNLLEAAYLLATGRSYRSARDRDMIGFERDHATVRGVVLASDGRTVEHETRLYRDRRRENLRSGAKLTRASDFSETLRAVMFTPDDLELVRGGAESRRRLLDACIAQLRPRYAQSLSEFTKLYTQKVRILSTWREKPSQLHALPEFNDALCTSGARLVYYRASFTLRLAERAREVHLDCSGGRETLSVAYRTVAGADTLTPDRAQIEHSLRLRQSELYDAEIQAGKCLTGAQRDDLELAINDVPARAFASQGQTRTAALALKLAERDVMSDDTGVPPVLLLDDVLSELDAHRRAFVLRRATLGQVIITRCDGDGIAGDGVDTRVFQIEGGNLISCTCI